MNRYLIIFFCLILYTYSNDKKLASIEYTNTKGEKGITYFDYNREGLSFFALWELESGKRFSLNYHYYDSKGNLTEKFREYSDHLDTRQIYRYNIKNQLMSEEFILQDTSRGISTFEYDKSGNNSRINCNYYFGWVNGQIDFIYNQNKKISGKLIQNGKETATIKYEYDGDYLVKEEWNFLSGGYQKFEYKYSDFTNIDKYTIISPYFNPKSPLIKKEEYSYDGKSNGPSYYRYDYNGKLTKKIFERNNNFKTSTFYFYDDKGVLFRAFRQFNDGKKGLFRYTFNKDRKMTEKLFFRNDLVSGYEKYTYLNNVLSAAEFVNSDFWLTGSIKYVTDVNGCIISGKYNDAKGYYANILFKYTNNLLSEINWIFSFGKKQIYTFEY